MNDYAQGYQLAVRHFESKDFIGAVKLAKYNLTDLHVPRYWQIKNCILVAYGTDDWYEAEEYRDAGELAYSLYHKATEPSDRSHQEALASVRVSLDQLAKQQTFLKPTDEDDYLEFEDESGEEDGGEEDGGDFGKEDEEDIEDPEEFIHIEDKQERLRKVLSNPDINAIEYLERILKLDPYYSAVQNEKKSLDAVMGKEIEEVGDEVVERGASSVKDGAPE